MKVLSSIGMKAALDRLSAGEIEYGTAALLKRRIDAGEPFDVAILMPQMIEALRFEPLVLAKSPMSVAVRSGAKKPDLGSVEAFRRALLEAKSIAYSKEGYSGKYAASVIERLGLAGALASKTVLETRSGAAAFNLAEGKAELALTIAAEIVPVPGAELAGPFPDGIGLWVEFAAGVAPHADAKAVEALIHSIQSPAGAAALRAAGLEPA